RKVVRLLDSLKFLGTGDLHQGVKLENGSMIQIQLEMRTNFSPALSLTVNDNKILMAASLLQEKEKKVVFVSKDFAARVKAEAIGLEAEDYENLKVSYDSLYKGMRKIEVTKHEVDVFYKDGKIELSLNDFRPNEYCVLTSPEKS